MRNARSFRGFETVGVNPFVKQSSGHSVPYDQRELNQYNAGPKIQRKASACALAHCLKVRGCRPVISCTVVRTCESSNSPSAKKRRNASTRFSEKDLASSSLASVPDSPPKRRSLPSTAANTRI